MRAFEKYFDETIRATEWFNAFDRLYGIRRRRIDFIRRNTRIARPFQDKKGKWVQLKWKTEPGIAWQKRNQKKPSRAGIIRQIISDLTLDDPKFAWGVTSRKCRTSPAVQMEWDFEETGDPIEESFLAEAINDECLFFLKSRGITPHFIFTGGWSIHVAFYCARHIPNKTWYQFVKCFRRSLFKVGEPCVNSLFSGMRLPLSIHHETGNLCRFAGTHTPDQVVQYANSVIQDDVCAAKLRQTVKDWYQLHPELNKPRATKVKSTKNFQATDSNEEQNTGTIINEEEYTLSLSSSLHSDIVSVLDYGDENQPLITTKYAQSHERRQEYEGYLRDGIKRHQSCAIIRNSDFIFWMLHKLNSKQRVWNVLAPVLALGVPDNVYGQRLDLLKWKLDHTDFQYTKVIQKRQHVPMTEDEGTWLFSLSESLHQDFCEQKAKKLLSLAYFLLQELRDFGEANIGVQQVADFLADKESSKLIRKASEYLAVFRRGKYKILEMTDGYRRPKAGKAGVKRKFRRVDQLPVLDGEQTAHSERVQKSPTMPLETGNDCLGEYQVGLSVGNGAMEPACA